MQEPHKHRSFPRRRESITPAHLSWPDLAWGINGWSLKRLKTQKPLPAGKRLIKNLLAPLIFPISGRELAPVPRLTLEAVVVASSGPSLGHSR
jgi:hypothetical protein